MSKTLNRHVVARHLDRAVYTTALPPEIAASATELVAEIDAGAGAIPAKTEALIADAWASTARQAAAAVKPADQRKALAALRSIAELEDRLGLAPVSDADGGADSRADDVAEHEPESDAETASYGTSYGYGEAS